MEHRIVIGSITYAVKGRDILQKNGFKAHIERKTAEYQNGCGYAVVFEGSTSKAEELLREADVKIIKTI